jgi:hypothetical protein
MSDHCSIADQLTNLAERLRALPAGDSDPGAWIEQLGINGDAMTASEVAVALECSSETVRRMCLTCTPRIGALIAGAVWIVSASRLLAAVEREKGKHAALVVRSRIRKMRRCGDHHKESALDVERATA